MVECDHRMHSLGPGVKIHYSLNQRYKLREICDSGICLADEFGLQHSRQCAFSVYVQHARVYLQDVLVLPLDSGELLDHIWKAARCQVVDLD